jgi:ankyrin repeat protein
VDLNAQDSDGWTALMYAVTVGGAEAVSKLVAAGVDQSVKNNDGDTAMDLAKANSKRHNLIQILDPKEPMPTVAE